jgi:DNA helicase II / ATP-dependent DNA helicase PcrA
VNHNDESPDSEADKAILGCLNIEKPRSFFLYAGAGSGKTRSLVNAVRSVCHEQGRRLSLSGQKLGVITYTNAACDEIKQRLEFEPRVEVSTIHAFAWSLVAGHDADIRQWVSARLRQDIVELEEAQAKGRPGSTAAADRARAIERKSRRQAGLGAIKRFVYNPNGDNATSDALNHAEVIGMTAHFLTSKPGLRRLLVSQFPILLIDECQDTSGRIMDALLSVEADHRDVFCLGLFGDVMQRIFAEGKDRLAEAIPECWERPRKQMNHRCPTRVVELINRIRQDADGEQQLPRSDARAGIVRLFIAPQAAVDKSALEAAVGVKMAEITQDQGWARQREAVKNLALEHMMLARRFGFEAFFEPLYSVERIRTSVLQGTGAGIGLLTREILPLVNALRASDGFAAAAILRRTSTLLERRSIENAGENQAAVLGTANEASKGLLRLLSAEEKPSAQAVLRYVADTRLFTIPDVLLPYVAPDSVAVEVEAIGADEARRVVENEVEIKSELSAWREALQAPFDQIEKYDQYVRGASQFDTHQGVKGLEFQRVMVVISDEEARGFMFAYDKLFGVKAKSKTDLENEAGSKETVVDRTRRLLYVTCSRAQESLAVVYYAADPFVARESVLKTGWFREDEIEIFGA